MADPKTPDTITYVPGPDDPVHTVWRGIRFVANVPQEVADPKMVKAAKGNRHFLVNGERSPDTEAPEPTTPQQYRAWAVRWFNECDGIDALLTRWGKERGMRDNCEIGYDDYKVMRPLLDPIFEQKRNAENVRNIDLQHKMMAHGLTILEWRV